MHSIAMPPHAIIIGIPIVVMLIMRWQHSMNMSFMAASIGVISQVMPAGVMVQVILHIIIGMGIMLFIMGIIAPIICIGIMPAIIGMVIGDIACIGIALLMVPLRIVMTAYAVVGMSDKTRPRGPQLPNGDLFHFPPFG